MKTPLSRPALPAKVTGRRWPHAAICVFGPGALELGRALAASSGWTLARGELRHAEGFSLTRTPEEIVWIGAPSALCGAPDALAREVDGPLVAVHEPLACALEAPTIWISGGRSWISVPDALRERAQRAALVLEEARLDTAKWLGARLRG